jgi:ApaG protein
VSEATTRGIRVEVQGLYEPDRSNPANGEYFFSYRVRISNLGAEAAQLVSRVWVITDGDGKEQVVQGPGVVGEQPLLEPGDAFEYTSFCPLPTPVGAMRGAYRMRSASGEMFDAEIASFGLTAPYALN